MGWNKAGSVSQSNLKLFTLLQTQSPVVFLKTLWGNLSPAWVPAWSGSWHDTCQLYCLVLNMNLLLFRITEKRDSELHRSGWPVGMAMGDSLDCWLRCKDQPWVWMAPLHELSPELCVSKESEPGCKKQACECICLCSLLLAVGGCSTMSSSQYRTGTWIISQIKPFLPKITLGQDILA